VISGSAARPPRLAAPERDARLAQDRRGRFSYCSSLSRPPQHSDAVYSCLSTASDALSTAPARRRHPRCRPRAGPYVARITRGLPPELARENCRAHASTSVTRAPWRVRRAPSSHERAGSEPHDVGAWLLASRSPPSARRRWTEERAAIYRTRASRTARRTASRCAAATAAPRIVHASSGITPAARAQSIRLNVPSMGR